MKLFSPDYVQRVRTKFYDVVYHNTNVKSFIKYHLNDIVDSIVEEDFELYDIFVNDVFSEDLHEMLYYDEYPFTEEQKQKIIYCMWYALSVSKGNLNKKVKDYYFDILMVIEPIKFTTLTRIELDLDKVLMLVGSVNMYNYKIPGINNVIYNLFNNEYSWLENDIRVIIYTLIFEDFYMLFNLVLFENNIGSIFNAPNMTTRDNILTVLKVIYSIAESMGPHDIDTMIRMGGYDIRNTMVIDNVAYKDFDIYIDNYPNIKMVINHLRNQLMNTNVKKLGPLNFSINNLTTKGIE